jgi:hypothetical protein
MVATPDYTVDGSSQALVDSVYRRVLSPNSQNTLQPADIIAFLDEEMRTTIVPLVLAAQEEFWVQNFDQPVVNGQFNYTIPPRAAFATWRDVVFIDANNNELNMSMLSPIPPEEIPLCMCLASYYRTIRLSFIPIRQTSLPSTVYV